MPPLDRLLEATRDRQFLKGMWLSNLGAAAKGAFKLEPKKEPSPRPGRGFLRSSVRLLSIAFFVLLPSRQSILEVGRRAHLGLAGIGPLEVRRLVPGQMVDRIRVFGVRLG